MRILAFDPGNCTGVALLTTWDGCSGHLSKIEAGVFDFDRPNLPLADLVVIEKPVIYPGGRGNGNPNDLITEALTAGEIKGMVRSRFVCDFKIVRPSDWKRQLSKDICWARVEKLLTEDEKAQLAHVYKMPKSVRHNVQDAIGIALWAAGRRVY